ncbi:MAG TPA: aminotransferase class III-fold pyridoxal phosphate-dependent enzyme, partial [Opitutaceae bacterium]|nr:aminotransferase class III-fold pyridoxal phosphate-dependent enzyme [Opitutaceae bacterium]
IPAAALPPLAESDGAARWARARTVISGGTGLLSKRAEQFDPRAWPAYFSRCEGCYVWDLAGRRYLDFAGGVGAIALGYNDPGVTAAVRRRLSLGTYCTLVNPDEVALAERLLALHPWAGKVRYARGGGEALTIAVRVARAATGRSPVLFCGYHGWHDWYLAANLGTTDALDGHLLPGLEPRGVPRELRGTAAPFRYNDLASFDAALASLKEPPAAIVMEPMRSQLPRDHFVDQIAARCRAAGAVFVLDEVTSGLRCGLPGAHTRLGVIPDLVVYAKAMSNGFPFGAVVGRDEIMRAADASFISSSYWTDAVGPAAALAVLDQAERLDLATVIWAKGEAFQATWRVLAARHPAARVVIGGIPAVPTLQFDCGPLAGAAKTYYVRGMAARGFLAATYHYLMHAHGEAEIASFFAAADTVLADLAIAAASGELAREAGGTAAQSGFARLA